MDFDVEYNLLDDLGLEVLGEKDNLIRLLKELLDIILDFSKSWDGVDCKTFQSIAIAYINSLLKTTGDIEYVGDYMRKAAGTYVDFDRKWGKTVKKIGEDYYDQEEQRTA